MSVKVDAADYLVELAKQEGISCATTSDGHVLIFTRKHLTNVLAAMDEKGQDMCVVLVKRQDMSS